MGIPTSPTDQPALPQRWKWLLWGFRKYAARYVRRHFHAVRLSNSSFPFPPPDGPVLVALNHPSWWDPLVGLLLSSRFSDRDQFAAIDEIALARYAFFARLGFVGVDTLSLRGAAAFLRIGTVILSEPRRVFWVTAQGRFADVRERPLKLRSGVGHLAARLDRGYVVPLALEYAFWNERTPEALARFGEPLRIADCSGLTGREWTRRIEGALMQTLDGLNAEAQLRDPSKFTAVVSGTVGIGGAYDAWRRIKAWAHGTRFDATHNAGREGRKE